ncbi:MAG: hypothetical protein JRJ86_04255 [Deltaproteobacteria bacterium]|nr:hypothetical protein [Deltaproteobacteria bacterium]MBW2116966.1 hypothetical protein [Deltaproteobacteria bacterium]MBW2344211.1 hypothetical protein [Deltaproteobacteria bacterium]
MKLLHILRSKQADNTKTLMEILSEGNEVSEFPLYDEQADYEKLIDAIFENDKVISWW